MKLFEEKNCSVASYALAATAKFGLQALDWDPLILRDAFQDTFQCKLSQRSFDKLQAGMAMIGTDTFSSTIEGFLACANSCNNKMLVQGKVPYVSLKQACWAVFLYKQLIGQQDTEQFSPDIILYIQELMKLDGISKLPEYMDFAKLTDLQMQPIQQALVQDPMAFQAYNTRQQNNVVQLNTYVKERQAQLITQLRELKQHKIIAQEILEQPPKKS